MTDYGRDVHFGVFITPSTDLLDNSYALADLADQPALAQQFGEAGQERLRRQFSIDKMVGDTELLYRELLEERGARQ